MSRRLDRAIVGLLVFVFICGLGVLAALVPVGHGFVPKGGGWFSPAVVGGAFTLHPLLVAVPWAACFVLGLLDWRRPWRVEHLDLLALAGFFPVAMLLSDDLSPAGLWLAAVCLGWLFARMLGAVSGHGGCRNCARPSAPGGWAWQYWYCCSSGSEASRRATSWMSGRRARSAPGAFCTDCTSTGRCPGRGPAGFGSTARTPTARSPTTRTSRSWPSSRRRRAVARDAAAGGVLRRADARRTAQARPAARRAAARASVHVRVPALPVSRPLLDGGDQRCADRRPLRMDDRRGSGAPSRSRAAHGSRRPDQSSSRRCWHCNSWACDGGARATR